MIQDSIKLQIMGIQSWDVAHPERLPLSHQSKLVLAEQCRLLFVSPVKPEGDSVLFYQKILKAMKLELTDTLHITPDLLLSMTGEHVPDWIWFAGDQHAEQRLSQLTQTLALSRVPNKLISPPLVDIDGNDVERRALWNQIRAYG